MKYVDYTVLTIHNSELTPFELMKSWITSKAPQNVPGVDGVSGVPCVLEKVEDCRLVFHHLKTPENGRKFNVLENCFCIFLLPRMNAKNCRQYCSCQQLNVCGVLKLKWWLTGESTFKWATVVYSSKHSECTSGLENCACGKSPPTPAFLSWPETIKLGRKTS